jgi:hypothetical protein
MYYHLEYSVRNFIFGDTYRGHRVYPTKEMRDAEINWMKTYNGKPTKLIYTTYETETLGEDKIII